MGKRESQPKGVLLSLLVLWANWAQSHWRRPRSHVEYTFNPRPRESDISTGSNLHWSKVAPGLFMNSFAFPGLHMPRKSWTGSPSYCTVQWKRSPEAEKVSGAAEVGCGQATPRHCWLPQQHPEQKGVVWEKHPRCSVQHLAPCFSNLSMRQTPWRAC